MHSLVQKTRRLVRLGAAASIALYVSSVQTGLAQSFHETDLAAFKGAAEDLFDGGDVYSSSATGLSFQIPERREYVRVIMEPDAYDSEAFYRADSFSTERFQKSCNERNLNCVVRLMDVNGAIGAHLTFQSHGDPRTFSEVGLHRDGSTVTIFSEARDRDAAEANLMTMVSFLKTTLLKN